MKMLFEKKFKRLKHKIDILKSNRVCPKCKKLYKIKQSKNKSGSVEAATYNALKDFFASNELSNLYRDDILKFLKRYKFTILKLKINDVIVPSVFMKNIDGTYEIVSSRAKAHYPLWQYFSTTAFLYFINKKYKKPEEVKKQLDHMKNNGHEFHAIYYDENYKLIEPWQEIVEYEDGLHPFLQEEFTLNSQGKWKHQNKIEPLKENDKSWQLFKNKLMPEKINSYSMSMTKPMDIFEICNENLRDLEMDSLFYLVAKPFESWYYKQSADPVICNICFVKKELRKLDKINPKKHQNT